VQKQANRLDNNPFTLRVLKRSAAVVITFAAVTRQRLRSIQLATFHVVSVCECVWNEWMEEIKVRRECEQNAPETSSWCKVNGQSYKS